MFCPNCHYEYREGFTTCADCNFPLTAEKPPATAKKTRKQPEYIHRELVTIKTFMHFFDTERAACILESEGIPAVALDTNAHRIRPTLGLVSGGARLQVDAENAERACDILEAYGYGPRNTQPGSHRCPVCQSEDIATQGLSKWQFVMVVVLLGAPLLFIKREFTCNACRHHWFV